jgi:hypothetical protein
VCTVYVYRTTWSGSGGGAALCATGVDLDLSQHAAGAGVLWSGQLHAAHQHWPITGHWQ